MTNIIDDSNVSVFSGVDNTHNGLRHIQLEFGTYHTLSQGQLHPSVNKLKKK